MDDPETNAPAEDPTRKWLAPLAVGVILCTFAMLKSYGFHLAAWDDNIYFYLADRMNDGLVPYRDFDHAHPPLHLLSISLFYRLTGGYSLFASRLLPGLASALTGIFLYRALRGQDRSVAVIACGVYLLSYHILRISTHLDGANLATLWLCIGLERLIRKCDLQAATFFVLAGFTLFNTIPAAIGACAVIFAIDRRRAVRLAAMGLGIFTLCVAATVAVTGTSFFYQVIGFHLGKATVTDSLAGALLGALRLNPWLVGASALGVVALILGPATEPEDKSGPRAEGTLAGELEARLPFYLALGAGLFSLLFLASIARVFAYYLTPLLLCMAPLAGYGLMSLLRRIRATARHRDREMIVAALILSGLFGVVQAPALAGFLVTERPIHKLEWKASGFGLADAIMRPLFWRDTRQEGVRALAWTHYLWAESDHFGEATRLAETVRQRAAEDDTLFGDGIATPLIALLAERRLALDMADTNYMRFERTPDALADTLARLEEKPPRFVVRREKRGLSQSRELLAWLADHYDPIQTTRNETATRIHQLFMRR